MSDLEHADSLSRIAALTVRIDEASRKLDAAFHHIESGSQRQVDLDREQAVIRTALFGVDGTDGLRHDIKQLAALVDEFIAASEIRRAELQKQVKDDRRWLVGTLIAMLALIIAAIALLYNGG